MRVLESADLSAFLRLSAQDPVVNVFADHRARTTNLEPRWLGGEVWGRFAGGELVAACHVGANLVPVQCTPDDARAFAERALARSRSVSTVVGPHEAVEPFWQTVSASWGKPRELRWRQPHLEISGPPQVEPDPQVRRTTRADLEELYPACVAMYTEEVGVSPEAGGGAELYRARVSQLISRGWSFARFDKGRLVFKAEVACASAAGRPDPGGLRAPDRRGAGPRGRRHGRVVARPQHVAPSRSTSTTGTCRRRAYERVGSRQRLLDGHVRPGARLPMPATTFPGELLASLRGPAWSTSSSRGLRAVIRLAAGAREIVLVSGVPSCCAAGCAPAHPERAGWASAACSSCPGTSRWRDLDTDNTALRSAWCGCRCRSR